ncbi:hypothetical protein [Glaciihabitans sp. dw_435]|uniref:hypothetical protein n=1 Tax=Glaciihabitans sp. dw_435 TaxID=2720081 RepID=UPI001BD66296|nr:hypothetical protein [Glaciihabitans sp. dw_435]
MGPIEVIVVTFSDAGRVSSIGPPLADLVSQGLFVVVDAVLVTRRPPDTVVISDLSDDVVPGWSAISPHPRPLLSAQDSGVVSAGLAHHHAAVLVAIEHSWVASFARDIADSGGAVVLHARIDASTVEIAARVDS